MLSRLINRVSEHRSVDAVEIQVWDAATNTYCGKFCELEHLTVDPEATGWDAVLAMARFVIATAAPLR